MIRLLAIVAVTAAAQALAQPCTPQPQVGYDFGTVGPGPFTGFYDGGVHRAAVYDSGQGPALFIAGTGFRTVGAQTSYLATFTGGHWAAIDGFNSSILCMTVGDLGAGPRLIVGGNFTQLPGGIPAHGVAQWDGTTWSAIGGDAKLGTRSLLIASESSGPVLYAGGNSSLPFVARWTGSAWTVLGNIQGNGNQMGVRALAVFDDGDGPRVFAAGDVSFVTPAGTRYGVASWDGTTWNGYAPLHALSTFPEMTSLAVHDAGSGPRLYVGGSFTGLPSPTSVNAVARLHAGVWEALTMPGPGPSGLALAGCSSLLSASSDTGPVLYAVVGSDSHLTRQVAAFRNEQWSILGNLPYATFGSSTSQRYVRALALRPGDSRLCAFGDFTRTNIVSNFGSANAPCAAVWNGTAWSTLEPVGNGLESTPAAILTEPGTHEDSVYADSYRFSAGLRAVTDLPIPSPTTLAVLHQPVVTRVISNGSSIYANSGAGWSLLPNAGSGNVWTATDTGSESLIIASGPGVYRYINGGRQLVAPSLGSGSVSDAATYDAGDGPHLYVGGLFDTSRLVRLDNGAWTAIPVTGQVRGLEVFNVGSGPELIIASSSLSSGEAGGVFAWNGQFLRAVTAGLPASISAGALRVLDVGQGPRLWCAVGNSLYQWDGAQWLTSAALTAAGSIVSMDAVRYANGFRSIFIGGDFVGAGGVASGHIAELKFCLQGCTADINHDGDSGTDADIEAFFACLAGNCCPTCTSADFNGDGTFGTDADIEAFFRVLAGGPC